jgi:hypothetical protein
MLTWRVGVQVDEELEAEVRAFAPTKAKHVVVGQPALQCLQRVGIIDEVAPSYSLISLTLHRKLMHSTSLSSD